MEQVVGFPFFVMVLILSLALNIYLFIRLGSSERRAELKSESGSTEMIRVQNEMLKTAIQSTQSAAERVEKLRRRLRVYEDLYGPLDTDKEP